MKKDSLIIVTGSKGQLGFDCVKELKKRGFTNVVGIDIDDLDITDEKEVKRFILAHKPSVVIHNAAWTAVDKAEENPDIVYKTNVLGPKYIAEACKRVKAKMVFMSTDYVFDGGGDKPFEVDSPKNPLSIYGKSKSLAEDEIIKTLNSFFIIRISWVFGINGSNFIKTILKLINNKTKIDVVCDQIGSPTYTKDLSSLIVDMIETTKYGIYHATNEGFCSWYELANYIANITNAKNQIINPITTQEYKNNHPFQAERPMNSRMSKKSLDDAGFSRLPNWQDSVLYFVRKELNYND